MHDNTDNNQPVPFLERLAHFCQHLGWYTLLLVIVCFVLFIFVGLLVSLWHLSPYASLSLGFVMVVAFANIWARGYLNRQHELREKKKREEWKAQQDSALETYYMKRETEKKKKRDNEYPSP